MRYPEFRTKVDRYPLFHSNIFSHLTHKPDLLRNQMVDWVRRGLVVQLKRGAYTLNDADRAVGLSPFLLANQLYFPSYISLETALNHYDLIPEAAQVITSVTTKKTQTFNNSLGSFIYHHIKITAFDCYTSIRDKNGYHYNIATPEKAIIDFLYFRTVGLSHITIDIFDESYRLQNLGLLDSSSLLNTAKIFNSKKLNHIVELLIKHKERSHD